MWGLRGPSQRSVRVYARNIDMIRLVGVSGVWKGVAKKVDQRSIAVPLFAFVWRPGGLETPLVVKKGTSENRVCSVAGPLNTLNRAQEILVSNDSA